jgi:flagellar FliL protein
MPFKKKNNSPAAQSTVEKAPARGGVSAPKMILFMVVAVLLGGGLMMGALTMTGLIGGNRAEAEEGNSKPVATEILKIDSMVVNLADPGGNRYVKVNTVLEFPKNKKLQEEIKEKEHQITESVLLTFRSKTAAEIQPLSKLDLVKQELMKNVNARLEHGQVKEVYFTEFIIH